MAIPFLVRLIALGLAAAPLAARAEGASIFDDWRQDAPGTSHTITPADLPPPFETRSAGNPSRIAAARDAKPQVPDGFVVTRAATGLSGPRILHVASNGDVFVAESEAGRVRVLRFTGDMSHVQAQEDFASGLEEPYGIAFYPPGPEPRFVYVAETDKVVRFPYRPGDLKAEGPAETIIANLPTGGHWTRDIVFSPDGRTLYLAVGSGTNVDEGVRPPDAAEIAELDRTEARGASGGEERGRAMVIAYDPMGRERRVVATGIRNCSGVAIEPGAGQLWCAVNERDGLGDNLPPDYATPVKTGGFYGWPWYYIGDHSDPRHAGQRPDLANDIEVPKVLLQPHSAPLGMAFYTGGQFPPDYRGDAFVALHGSWNRAKRTGYKVVRLRMKDGAPTGAYQDFMTGFVVDDRAVSGRPVGVAVAADGSLLVSDDAGGVLWRIARR